ncbi:MAG: response regulator [Calditrichaeota bacterium]|nr:MAG: response regulator [Calditrichota bacterium]
MDEMVELVRKRLNGEAVEPEKVLDQLKLYQSSYLIGEPEEATAESDVEAVEFQSEEAIVSEMPSAEKVLEEEEYIFLQEQDQELLEIFQSEVTNNFTLIDKHLDNLEKYTYDKEVLREVERAVHEIRSAAKMLGIGEIAAIGDPLEQIVEKIIHQRPENFHGLIPMLRNAMIVVKELTTQHRVRKSDYENTLNELNTYLETGEVLVTEPEQPSLAADLATRDVVYEPEGKREVSPQVIEMFVHEAREQLDDINYLLLKLEKDPQNEDLQHHLMRCMHTLKGSAGMVYSNKIENLAHRCEDIIEYYIQQHQPLPESLFDTLFRVVDEMNGALDSIKDNQEETLKNYDQLMAALDKYSLKAAPAETPRPTPPEPEPKKKEVPSESATPSQFYPMPPQKKDTFIRLNINTMNHLLNLAAELVISNNQFKSQLDRLKELSPQLNSHLKLFRDTEDYISTIIRESNRLQEGLMDLLADSPGATESLKNQQEKLQQILKNVRNLQDEFTSISHILKDNSKTYDENLQKLNKLSNELLDEILQARLVPINLLFQRFHRPIRDLARQMQKQIRLKMSGEDTELDRRLIEDLYEPLLHIIRNAIDHGIESEEERKAAGKPPEGLIEIKASRDRNQVIVEISDDGRGIDVEKIKQKALEKGLIDEEESEKLSDLEVFEFLFHSGFTTSEDTTMVSGRGVGLDVVKSQIEKAKGDIRIYTEKGKGTTFSIRVPISLSVIQSMLVEVNGHVYSIPLLQVEETLSVNVEDIVTDEGKQYIRYRERKIPVIHLNQLLKVRDENKPPQLTPDQYPVIIVQDEGNRASLLVDKIIRREEILIKSLGPGLKRLKYISGGSIMADGQVVLVLDVPQIIQDSIRGLLGASGEGEGTETLKSRVKKSPPPSRQKKIIEGRKPAVLIVDDSLSIRKYLSSLLMQNGYKTETARNGYEALELLNKHHFDLMVTDLEMPKLSGYELIETLRYDQRFSSFPIIVLTGRAGENFRELTTELGADAYIVKPFNDRELLNQIEAFIEYKA